MEKFSDIEKEKKKYTEPKVLWNEGDMSIIKIDDWSVLKEPDMVIVLPYLIEKSCVILRQEDVPSYKLKFPSTEKFFTVISGKIEENETPDLTIRRELVEECGIKLEPDVKIELHRPLFVFKGGTAQYHICILPLMEEHFSIVLATGDGSASEKKSNSVWVNIQSLRNEFAYDLITKYTIDLFLKDYNH